MNQKKKSENTVFAANRMEKVSSYLFSKLDQIIAKHQSDGKKIIRLDIGSPDLPPHVSVIKHLYHSSSKHNAHGYQSHLGPLAYRQAWTTMYQKVFGVTLDPESSIIPLTGTKEGLFHLLQATIDPGDIVLIPDPHYPTYLKGTEFAEGTPYFLPNLKAIPKSVAQKAKILWLNYPNNPMGATATFSFYEEAVKFAHKYDILICSDAAYTQVTFGKTPATSILQIPGAEDVAIEFNSLSKSHNMAGWRIGVMVGKHPILKTYLSLKTNLDSGQFLPIMEAAITAIELDSEWLYERNRVYKKRMDNQERVWWPK